MDGETETQFDITLITGNAFNLGGKIRALPRDFIVEEVWDNRVCKINYSLVNRLRDQMITKFQREKDYLHFTLVKQNWDTIRALNYIRRKLGFSLKRFGIAGMKDKRAITAQRVSLWKGKVGNMVNLKFKDIFLKDFDYADERINLGNAVGNRFTITIRDIPRKKREITERLNRFRKVVTSTGVPNYFGPQRLGGRNADVGKAIKEGNLKLGVEIILEKVKPYLLEGCVENIPRVFWYEKKMLHHLKKYPNDYAGALRRIPKKILKLYVHAYQSHIFNEELKQALYENKVPKTIRIAGFSTPKIPELRTFTIKRRAFLTTNDFKIMKVRDGIAILRFTLAKGEYASTLLSNFRIIQKQKS